MALPKVDSSQQGPLGPLGLTQEMMEAAQDLAEARTIHQGIEKALQDPVLPKDMFSAAIAMADKVRDLKERSSFFQEEISTKMPVQISSVARKILSVQWQGLNAQVADLAQACSLTLAGVLQRAREESEKALGIFQEKVCRYLDGRSPTDLVEARGSAQSVGLAFRHVQLICWNEQSLSGREVEVLDEERNFAARLGRLNDWIGMRYYGSHRDVWGIEGCSFADAVQRLEDAVGKNWEAEDLDRHEDFRVGDIGGCKLDRKGLDAIIDQLQEEAGSPLVDHWVWKLAGEPSEKNYGLVHRYDDVGRLKDALRKSAHSLASQIMKEEGQDLDREEIYLKLYELIGKPHVENPMGWMKLNACYYIGHLKAAIRELSFLERPFSVIESRGNFASVESHRGAVSSLMQPAPALSLETHPHSNILNELAEVALDREKLTPQLKEQVEEMIGELSQKGLAQTIDFEVWRHSKDLNKGGANWGSVHRYDDLDALGKALMIAIRKDVEKAIAAKNFPDEEDRTAFYAQIGKMAFGKQEVPTDIDLAAYGRECIPLHLQLVDPAVKAVREQIREKKLEQAKEAVFNSVVEAAVAKDPAALPIAELLKFIKETGQEDVEECKEMVHEHIEDPDLDPAIKDRIFDQIWKEAGEPDILDFGKNHYLDDLGVLRTALFAILVDIAV
ncbi:MAG: hypothetical protein JSR39_07555 [Verrucomicrobia bacterium]|nr:hypothetical protein [Verrucomicrobiota bacterium]